MSKELEGIVVNNSNDSELAWFARKGNLYALAILALITIGSSMALEVDTRWVYLLVYLWFGVAYGVLLQYGRFCMASAVRDLFAVGVPRMAVGVLIAVALFSLSAAVVKVMGVSTYFPNPIGWHGLIGGALFGFGMVFAGGCASGSLYKCGEGNIGSMLVILSISFSQVFYVTQGGWLNKLVPAAWTASALSKHMPATLSVTNGWFDQYMAGYIWNLKSTTLGKMLGFDGVVSGAFIGDALLCAILPALLILIFLYAVYYRKGYLRRRKVDKPTVTEHLHGIWSMLTASHNTAIAGLGLGIFAGLHMWVIGALRNHYGIFNFGELLARMGHTTGLSIQNTVFDPGYWYITTQEAQWGGWVLHQLGMQNMDNIFYGLENGLPNPLFNAPGWMSIGIILGAASMALMRREFKWKVPSLETAIFALVGGAFMGLGARIGLGCNIGAFFAAVTNGDPSGWVFLAGMVVGAYLGVKLFSRWLDWRASREGFAI